MSASWTVPSTAVSGVYIAHLVRNDTGGDSHIAFVVRDDASHSDVVVQTSDSTWQAYNTYGGNSLYTCTVACPPGNPPAYKAAYKVSYNRPFDTARRQRPSSLFHGAEYTHDPLPRGATATTSSYISGVDTPPARLAAQQPQAVRLQRPRRVLVGDAARQRGGRPDAGVNLAFFSGNEMFWKTRFEPSADGTNTPDRTLVSYKDTHFTAQRIPWRGPAPGATRASPRPPTA